MNALAPGPIEEDKRRQELKTLIKTGQTVKQLMTLLTMYGVHVFNICYSKSSILSVFVYLLHMLKW